MTPLARRTREPSTLPEFANLANRYHAQAERAINQSLKYARKAGDLLLRAKASDEIQHGEWGDWVRANFDGSYRTARAYMQIADRWDEIEANWQRVANFGVRDALNLIAEPRETPDDDSEPTPRPVGEPANPPATNDASRSAPQSDADAGDDAEHGSDAAGRDLPSTNGAAAGPDASANGSGETTDPEPGAPTDEKSALAEVDRSPWGRVSAFVANLPTPPVLTNIQVREAVQDDDFSSGFIRQARAAHSMLSRILQFVDEKESAHV